MTELAIFRYEGADVRTVTIDGEPWFVLADLTRALGLSQFRTDRLSGDVIQSHPIADRIGRSQSTLVVSEAGMYEVVIRSDKPEAAAFRGWITRDVLPSIRRTGSYSTASALTDDEIVHQALAITARRVEHLETRVAELEPVAAHAETFRQAEGLRTIGDVANDFKAHCAERFPGVKVKHQDVWDQAGRLGIVIRADSIRHNQPTAQAIEAGWARAHRTVYDTATRGQQTSVTTHLTPKGEARLWDGLAAWLGAHGTLTVGGAR